MRYQAVREREPKMSMAIRLQIGAGLTALALASTMVLQVSSAAFSDTTDNSGNSVAAGTVVLADSDSGSAMYAVTNMKPGDTVERCIRVTYTGTLASSVKLYGSVAGTGLATYLDMIVQRGSGLTSPGAADCTGFTSAATIYNDDITLAGFATAHTNYANGAGAVAATENDTVDYRFVLTLQDNNSAQGLNASATFTWEAQNT